MIRGDVRLYCSCRKIEKNLKCRVLYVFYVCLLCTMSMGAFKKYTIWPKWECMRIVIYYSESSSVKINLRTQ